MIDAEECNPVDPALPICPACERGPDGSFICFGRDDERCQGLRVAEGPHQVGYAKLQLGLDTDPDANAVKLRDAVDGMKAQGLTWFRVTPFEKLGVAYLEGWREPQVDPPACVPWLVAAR